MDLMHSEWISRFRWNAEETALLPPENERLLVVFGEETKYDTHAVFAGTDGALVARFVVAHECTARMRDDMARRGFSTSEGLADAVFEITKCYMSADAARGVSGACISAAETSRRLPEIYVEELEYTGLVYVRIAFSGLRRLAPGDIPTRRTDLCVSARALRNIRGHPSFQHLVRALKSACRNTQQLGHSSCVFSDDEDSADIAFAQQLLQTCRKP